MDAAANRSLDSAWSLDLHLILHCPTLSPESTLSLHSAQLFALPSTAHRQASALALPWWIQDHHLEAALWAELQDAVAGENVVLRVTVPPLPDSFVVWDYFENWRMSQNECFPQFRLPPNHGRHSSRTPVFQKLFDERMSHAFMPVTRRGGRMPRPFAMRQTWNLNNDYVVTMYNVASSFPESVSAPNFDIKKEHLSCAPATMRSPLEVQIPSLLSQLHTCYWKVIPYKPKLLTQIYRMYHRLVNYDETRKWWLTSKTPRL